nr:hypothetical protein [uncultured Pedobacter sp.]
MKNILNEGVSQEPSKTGYDALSVTNKNKFDALVIFYSPKDALNLVQLLEPRGSNSYANVYDKANAIKSETEYNKVQYAELMSASFEVDSVYSTEDVNYMVADCRRKFNLPPITIKVKQNSMNELNKFFIVKPEYHIDDMELPKNKRRIIGYKIAFDLVQITQD